MRYSFLLFGLLLFFSPAFAQEHIIKGTVTDALTKEVLPGVSVQIQGTSTVTATDNKGNYSISVPSGSTVIQFLYMGYQKHQATISATTTTMDVALTTEAKSLATVVVTGYTQQSKSRTTGAVSTLPAAAIAEVPVASFDQALQGRIPGVYVASASGLPGTPGRVTIRGIGSLQDGKTTPLYIVDGVPVSATSFAALNTENFESISVLKDAASTGQYGSRAANGVFVITTKKGKPWESGKTRITYRNQFGISQVNNSKWDMMNTDQRLQFEEILQDPTYPGWAYSRKNPNKLVNGQLVPKTTLDFQTGDRSLDSLRHINNDWRKKLLRTGFNQMHALDISGGDARTSFYISGSYYNQEGVLYNSGLERYNLQSNIRHSNGRLTLGLNLGLAYVNSRLTEGDFNVSETNPVASLYFSLPYENPYRPDGSLATGTNKFGANALAKYEDVSRREGQLKGILSANASYQLNNEFKIKATIGVDHQQFNNRRYIKPDSYFGKLVFPGQAGSYTEEHIANVGFVSTGGINYNKQWGGGHEIDVNLLAEANLNTINSSGFTGYGLLPGLGGNPAGITPGTSDNNLIPTITGKRSESLLLSQIGLFRYSYSDKYTLSASLRRDGSSRVPEANRYKYFYAFGASWNIMKEDFMAKSKDLSTLRLRASYGRTGNASGFASDFGYRSLYGASNYGGSQALVPQYPGNPNYNWELNYMSDLGLEFGLFNDRIRGEVDIYNRITTNLFVQKKLSLTSGFESMATNAGKIRNSGIEVMLEGDVVRKKDFNFTVGLNLAYNKNRILSLGGAEEIVTDEYSIQKVGQALGHFYMVRWGGVDPQTGAPIYLKADGTPTNTYNPDDAVLVKGSFDPPIKGGLTLGLTYKRFQVSTLFSFIKGMYRLNTGELYRTSADPNYRQYNQSVDMLNIWQKPGDITNNPGASYARYMTDRELQNADYIKLRNVSISYTLPKIAGLSKHVRNIKVFAQGQNLITWTKFKAMDPEDDNNWYQYEYPMPRTITAGINVSF